MVYFSMQNACGELEKRGGVNDASAVFSKFLSDLWTVIFRGRRSIW